MSNIDIDRMRATTDYNVRAEDTLTLVVDQVNTAGYAKVPEPIVVESDVVEYNENRSFWNDVIGNKLREGKSIFLREFHLTEWIPLSPGTYFLPDSEARRNFAKAYWSYGGQEYLPLGKEEMILSGMGSLRLKSIFINSRRHFFLGLTSTGVTHQGLPVAVSEEQNGKLIDKLKEYGGCLCNVSGHIEVVPENISLANYNRNIPKYYILADKIDFRETSQKNTLTSSAAIMFQSQSDHDKDPFIGKKWSFSSFDPASKASLNDTVDWLINYARRYGEKPVFLNNFDQYYEHFPPVEFPLMADLDELKIQKYQKYNRENIDIVIHTNEVVMGDVIKDNVNSNIVNRSNVENSFNKIKNQYDEETSKALIEIAKFIDRSQDPTAVTLYKSFTEELEKTQPDKSRLKSFWSGIQDALPSIASLAESVAKVVTLIG